MTFEIGQIFENEYPPEAAEWCNESGKAYIEQIEPANDVRRFQIIAIPAPSLDELKAQKLTELKTIRDAEEVKPISYQGYRFDYNDKARDRISAAIIALDVSKGQIAWTTADNTEVMVNADDLRMVIATVAVRSNKLHNAYRTAKEKVLEATTKEEVEKVILNNG